MHSKVHHSCGMDHPLDNCKEELHEVAVVEEDNSYIQTSMDVGGVVVVEDVHRVQDRLRAEEGEDVVEHLEHPGFVPVDLKREEEKHFVLPSNGEVC